MPIHEKAFWLITFFIFGILLASLLNDWQEKIPVALLASFLVAVGLLILGRKQFAFLAFFIAVGSGYYFVFDEWQKDINMPFGDKTVFFGVIINVSSGLNKQDLVLELSEPHKGKIQIAAPRYPAYDYGDFVEVNGTVEKPREQSEKFFEKEGIAGTVGFPEIKLLKKDQGSAIKAALLKIKLFAEESFKKVLPQEKAAFIAGLTLGETAEFSKEFKEKMKLTGTTHLVALSGYNIAIIATAVFSAFSFFFSRKYTFLVSLIVITGFVIMTGAEASVVRAAIMASILLLAGQVQRAYSFRNSIAIAACSMILFNPKILVWDIGFQLSFFAVVGLIYLKPAIEKFFKVNPDKGFLSWKEDLLTTLSAQMAVLPILFSNFGSFSAIAIITNVLILTFIPLTMFIGFSIVAASLISHYLAQVLGWLANIFLAYEFWIIEVFSKVNLQIDAEGFSLTLSVVYYLALAWFIIYANKKQNANYANLYANDAKHENTKEI